MTRTTAHALLCALACVPAFGQPTATFEVASVKPSPALSDNARVYFGPPRGGPGTPDPGQITWSYATLRYLLMTAYDVKAYQLNGPDWLNTERYDIVAKLPGGATKEQVSLMWQNLLAERFGLVLHHELKEFQVEELVVGKGGPRLKETAEDPAAPLPPGPPRLKDGALLSPGVVSMISPGPPPKVHTVARAQPLSQLAAMLSNQLNRPVLDKTGLAAKYDFTLDYNLNGLQASPDNAGEPGLDLAAAVQQQLGVRLVAGKASIDVLVVD